MYCYGGYYCSLHGACENFCVYDKVSESLRAQKLVIIVFNWGM